MALSDKEMQRLSSLMGSRKTTDFSSLSQVENAPTGSGVQERLATIGQGSANKIKQAIAGTGQYEGQNPLTRGVAATAAGFTTVPQAALAMTPEPVRNTAKAVGDTIGAGFKVFTELVGSNPALQKWTQDNPEVTSKIMEALQGTADLGAIAGTIAGTKGTVNVVGKTGELISKGTTATSKLVSNTSSLVKNTIKSPEKNLPDTVGEVLQGKPQDISKGIKAFNEIDTTDVKTYTDLGNKIDESIGRLSEVVDTELAKDITKTPLSELNTTLKTKSGNTVSTNYVDTALKQMKELYETTGDVQKAADIDELITSASTDGLTKLDVNNIARVYNTEFGSKAFNKLGEPLTSVNAQLYETVRKGLKTKAREGVGGAQAKAADEAVSSLYNTKTLVEKNIDAVNKLQQKITERGVFEKAGYLVSKYADILTGGVVRGVVGGLLPRGAGYKTMNALDLESRLQKNLELIKKASEATTDAEMQSILKQIDESPAV